MSRQSLLDAVMRLRSLRMPVQQQVGITVLQSVVSLRQGTLASSGASWTAAVQPWQQQLTML